MDSSSADPNAAAAAAAAASAAAAAASFAADPPAAADPTSSTISPEQQLKDQLAACWAAASAAESTSHDPNFDVFVSLASTAEKTGDAAEIEKALELLLKRFPLCYGYWKKLAEAKAKVVVAEKGDDDERAALAASSEVFERGLSHVGSTPELWLSFLTKLSTSKAAEESEIRSVFERAVRESGDAWGAGPLWEAFAAWEGGLSEKEEEDGEEQGKRGPPRSSAPRRAAAVLFRGACQPIRDAEVLRARLHELASRHSVSELAASEEEAEAARAAARPAGGGEEGRGAADAVADEAAARAAWLSTLEGSSAEFSRGLALRGRRYPFECRIRRTYWNSRPLDADQLRAWWSLLDDAEGLLVPMPPPQAAAAAAASSSSSSSSSSAAAASASAPYPRQAIDRLYRRCLVACAAYPEFWRRRARWLLEEGKAAEEEEGGGGEQQSPPNAAAALEAARAAASAAVDFHCRSRPEALLFASRLDEAAGDFDAAREKLVRTRDVVSPGLAAAAAAVAHLDRRRAVFEFLASSSAKKGSKKTSTSAAALEEEAKKRGAAAARLCLNESIDKAATTNTAASLSCVAALSLQAAALTNDDGDVKAGREALSKGLKAAPGEAAVWEAAATFEARWGDKEGSASAASLSAATVAVAILQAAAAPPASAVPGLERAIAEARAALKTKKSSEEGGEEENGGEKEEKGDEEKKKDDDDETEIPLANLPLPADAVRRARAAGFPLAAPFTPPGWPCALPESKLSHADRAALSARSIALAEALSSSAAAASSSAASGGNGGSGVSLLRDAATLHDQRFGYSQAATANIVAAAAAGATGGGAGGAMVGAKRPFVPAPQQQQQWQPRPRTFYPRPQYNPHWQQQQQWPQQQPQQWQQPQQQQQWPQQQWPQQNYQQQP